MSAGAASVDAGWTAAWAAARSMTNVSRRTTPTNGRPCRSKVPSLKGVAAWACTFALLIPAAIAAAASNPRTTCFIATFLLCLRAELDVDLVRNQPLVPRLVEQPLHRL